jgi:clan AA aspartic protease
VPIKLTNPFLDAQYPLRGVVMAVVDTGFTGFVLTPSKVFRALKFDQLKTSRVRGELADGTSIELQAAYGILEVPEIEHEDEGLIEFNPKIKEILLGVRGIKKLKTIVNGCKSLISMEKCE